jgi:hypothetical protein
MHLMVLLVLTVAAGCERLLPLDNHACPCVPGYVCDLSRRTCVRDVEGQADAAVSDGRSSGHLAWQLLLENRVGSIWANGANDIYVAGTGVFHSEGHGTWTQITPTEPSFTFGAIWGSGPGDLYVGGYVDYRVSALLHLTGIDSWTWAKAPAEITAIWGSAVDDIWAVGEPGTIMHSTGHDVWEPFASPVSDWLWSVWGTSSVNAYAVGQRGTILRRAL